MMMPIKLGKETEGMDREAILKKAQAENRGRDAADLDAQQKGAWIGYLIGIVGMILVNIVNGTVLKTVNHGPNMVICLMACAAFFIKYRMLKKKHEGLVALIYGVLALMFLVFWLLQLFKVW